MSEDPSTTDLKKDELSLAPAASELEKTTEKETPSGDILEMTSCSSISEISDLLSMLPENHSEVFKTFVMASGYKITLEQARRMAINTAKRAQKRRERALERDGDIENSAGNQ
jgi:hypothetical protein